MHYFLHPFSPTSQLLEENLRTEDPDTIPPPPPKMQCSWIRRSDTSHLLKWSHFDLKSWVTGGTKIRPGIPSN